jgi:hypothetical protein
VLDRVPPYRHNVRMWAAHCRTRFALGRTRFALAADLRRTPRRPYLNAITNGVWWLFWWPWRSLITTCSTANSLALRSPCLVQFCNITGYFGSRLARRRHRLRDVPLGALGALRLTSAGGGALCARMANRSRWRAEGTRT